MIISDYMEKYIIVHGSKKYKTLLKSLLRKLMLYNKQFNKYVKKLTKVFPIDIYLINNLNLPYRKNQLGKALTGNVILIYSDNICSNEELLFVAVHEIIHLLQDEYYYNIHSSTYLVKNLRMETEADTIAKDILDETKERLIKSTNLEIIKFLKGYMLLKYDESCNKIKYKMDDPYEAALINFKEEVNFTKDNTSFSVKFINVCQKSDLVLLEVYDGKELDIENYKIFVTIIELMVGMMGTIGFYSKYSAEEHKILDVIEIPEKLFEFLSKILIDLYF